VCVWRGARRAVTHVVGPLPRNAPPALLRRLLRLRRRRVHRHHRLALRCRCRSALVRGRCCAVRPRSCRRLRRRGVLRRLGLRVSRGLGVRNHFFMRLRHVLLGSNVCNERFLCAHGKRNRLTLHAPGSRGGRRLLRHDAARREALGAGRRSRRGATGAGAQGQRARSVSTFRAGRQTSDGRAWCVCGSCLLVRVGALDQLLARRAARLQAGVAARRAAAPLVAAVAAVCGTAERGSASAARHACARRDAAGRAPHTPSFTRDENSSSASCPALAQ
jgi:hypothetical protein